jgi:hypothetical protein
MELLVGRAGEKEFLVDAQELVTGRTCVIAQSGAGKSWAIAVICERLCRSGIGFCIIDTEGEYYSLKDKYQVLWLGTDEHADLDIEKVNLRDVMTKAIKNSTAVIFDVSETEMRGVVSDLAHVLYEIENDLRLPYLLIIEEADKFIPQSRDSLKKLEEISRRGRKRGLGMVVATQRPSLVNKNVLSQCNSQMIGKLSIENDLRAVDLFFSSRREVEELASLMPGEFFVMGKITRQKTRITFAQRETRHKGITPRLVPRPPPPPPSRAPRAVLLEKPAVSPLAEPLELAVHSRGVAPALTREAAHRIAEQRRKKGVLGRSEEHIATLELVYWPIIRVTARYLGGLIRASPRETTFLLDGVHAHLVDLARGLRVKKGFGAVRDCSMEAVRVLRSLPPQGATVADLEGRTQLSAAAIREALHALREKKLVTDAGTQGSAKLYVPLVRFRPPRLGSLRAEITTRLVPVQGGEKATEVTEEEIRAILKGIEPTAEVVEWSGVYYPCFEVTYTTSRGVRTIYIDAVSGAVVSLSVP